MAISDVVVIGAGPFGLSISAHLRHRGVEHTIVGRPMDTWRSHMPLGLFLKSVPYGSAISAATRGYDIKTWTGRHGLDDYPDWSEPLSLDAFLSYADWFTDQLVPDVRDLTVTSVTPSSCGFKVEFAEEAPVQARQVIVATGVLPYAAVPDELSGLPPNLMTHSSAHRHLDQFRGRRVAVVGGGQSALQTAALLHEAGADVQVIARRPEIAWETRNAEKYGLASHIMRPRTPLCEGWACVVYNSPGTFRMFPRHLRVHKAQTTFGPSGAWWLRDRVEGVVDILTGRRLVSAETYGSGVRVKLDGPRASSIDADHVIAGTGFRVDLSKLPFLSEEIQAGVAKQGRCPTVNRAGESTVPGLYFAGAHTVTSLGPGVRFIAGTHHTSARLARTVARRANGSNAAEQADFVSFEAQPDPHRPGPNCGLEGQLSTVSAGEVSDDECVQRRGLLQARVLEDGEPEVHRASLPDAEGRPRAVQAPWRPRARPARRRATLGPTVMLGVGIWPAP
jgi:thioredoxin reductase